MPWLQTWLWLLTMIMFADTPVFIHLYVKKSYCPFNLAIIWITVKYWLHNLNWDYNIEIVWCFEKLVKSNTRTKCFVIYYNMVLIYDYHWIWWNIQNLKRIYLKKFHLKVIIILNLDRKEYLNHITTCNKKQSSTKMYFHLTISKKAISN